MNKAKLRKQLFWTFLIIFFISVFLVGFKITPVDKTFIFILFLSIIFGGGALESKFDGYEERISNLEKKLK